MRNYEKVYLCLCTLFCVLMLIGNLTYQKFIFISFLGLHTFELSVGVLFYPSIFLLSDLITEFYGKQKARFCVKLAISMNMITAAIITVLDRMPATSWSNVNNDTFHLVFGSFNVMFLGSMLACYIAQFTDISVYSWIKRVTKGRWIWLRTNSSRCLSLFVDTSIVIGFLTLFKLMPTTHAWPTILNSYMFKLFFTLSSTPFFYLCVSVVRWLLKEEPYTPNASAPLS